MLLEILLFILALVLVATFATGLVIFYAKFKAAESLAVKKTLETALLQNQLRLELERKATEELGNSEGFIKFLSESRDWAFQYIETVQELITKLQTAVKSKDQKAIEEAQEELFNQLPEEVEE